MPRTQVVDNQRPDTFVDPKKFSAGKPYRRVRIRLHKSLRNKFMMSVPKGFSVTLHRPNRIDPNQFYPDDHVNVTFQVNSVNPDPKYVTYMSDIDTFLNNLNRIHPSIKILSDKVTEKEAGVTKPPQSFVDTVLGHPGLEGSRDELRSKAKDVIDVEMTESQVKAMEATYEKAKKDFIRTRLNDAFITDIGEDSRTHEKKYRLQIGRI